MDHRPKETDQAILVGNALGLLPQLRPVGIPMLRNIVCFLQKRGVDRAFIITHESRVSIPIPGASKASTVVDDADIVCSKSCFHESCAVKQASKATSYDDDLLLITVP